MIARVAALLALVGCAGAPTSFTFTDDGGLADPGAGPDSAPGKGPFDITIASSPPIDVPGAVLWLDPNFGVAHAGDDVRAWTDRSGFGLVVERPPVDQLGPSLDLLGDQRALRFGGGARLVLSNAVDQTGRQALTLGADFVIALVVAPADDRPAAALSLTPDVEGAGALRLETAPVRLTLDQAGQQIVVAGTTPLAPGRAHVLIAACAGGMIDLRVDGESVGAGGFRPVPFPFESPSVGGVAPEAAAPGLTGLLGDVVIVAGDEAGLAVAPLEDYLRHKYGL